MKNIRIKSIINVSWTLIEGGQTKDLSPYTVSLFIITGVGRTRAEGVKVSSSNVVTWKFLPEDQTFKGLYSLQLNLTDTDGNTVYSFTKRDLFRLSDTMYDYYGTIPIDIVSTNDEGVIPTPEYAGLIQKVYTEEDFGGEFAADSNSDTFNAHAINRLHERVSDVERIVAKGSVITGTTADWDASVGYIPDLGVIVVYTDHQTKDVNGETVYVPGIKIGDGLAYVQDLPFVDDVLSAALAAHIADGTLHTSQEEKLAWNRKLNVDDNSEVVNEALIFNRN